MVQVDEAAENELIELAQRGDTAAFETLVGRHASMVYNLALRTLGDPHEAEDVAQEAFVRAWRGLPNFRAEAQLGTWLYRIVTNLCYNRLPRLRQELAALDPDTELMVADTAAGAEHTLLTAELRQQLQTAFDQLPESYRLVLTLRYVQELSYDEIAAVLAMPLGTVKAAISRGRAQLQAHLTRVEL